MRLFDIGAKDGPEVVSDRILTIPNVLSLARLLILPFVYLDLAVDPIAHGRALTLIAVFAATDWFDGYIARRFDQVSRFGKLLDPISDRILIVVVGVGMVVGGLIPAWAVAVIVVRDVLVLAVGLVLVGRGVAPPAVTRLGKAATFGLMVALPLMILASVVGDGPDDPQPALAAAAWVTYGVNALLYYVAAFGYARTLRRTPAAPVEPGSGP